MTLTLDPHDLTEDALTDRVRIWQRRSGHRYSVDDVATAWLAVRASSDATTNTCLDLGCGIGSVLLMVADRLPSVRAVGIEAQASSYALAERNIEVNRLSKRVSAHFGDLRDPALLERVVQFKTAFGHESGFDLVTGTPPYKPLGTATLSPDPQRAHARVELRGGVEAYLAAAGRVLAADGCCVICAESGLEQRVAEGALAAGLKPIYKLDVWPMSQRKGRLFAVHCLVPQSAADGGEAVRLRLRANRPEWSVRITLDHEQISLRDEHGARTAAAHGLRTAFGLSIAASEAPSPPRARRASDISELA
jgi:tRNA1Val (adenine37-N6)-methyltransferase